MISDIKKKIRRQNRLRVEGSGARKVERERGKKRIRETYVEVARGLDKGQLAGLRAVVIVHAVSGAC